MFGPVRWPRRAAARTEKSHALQRGAMTQTHGGGWPGLARRWVWRISLRAADAAFPDPRMYGMQRGKACSEMHGTRESNATLICDAQQVPMHEPPPPFLKGMNFSRKRTPSVEFWTFFSAPKTYIHTRCNACNARNGHVTHAAGVTHVTPGLF